MHLSHPLQWRIPENVEGGNGNGAQWIDILEPEHHKGKISFMMLFGGVEKDGASYRIIQFDFNKCSWGSEWRKYSPRLHRPPPDPFESFHYHTTPAALTFYTYLSLTLIGASTDVFLWCICQSIFKYSL